MTQVTAKNNFKFEITKNDDGDYDYLGKGGDVLDYLATLAETFVQLCKDNQLPVYPLIEGMFKQELSENDSDSIDNLEEYLVAYDEENIQKIRDEKMQLVTANEFLGLHQEKLETERKIFRPSTIYSIPSDIVKILDEIDTIEADIPKEVWDWVDETKDDYLVWIGRKFLVLAYCNPLTSPKLFPNIWKVE